MNHIPKFVKVVFTTPFREFTAPDLGAFAAIAARHCRCKTASSAADEYRLFLCQLQSLRRRCSHSSPPSAGAWRAQLLSRATWECLARGCASRRAPCRGGYRAAEWRVPRGGVAAINRSPPTAPRHNYWRQQTLGDTAAERRYRPARTARTVLPGRVSTEQNRTTRQRNAGLCSPSAGEPLQTVQFVLTSRRRA